MLKNNKGFTIIEVLIVLAIAGVIMLVVFLAVPALQRNSRNTQRTNDAAQIVSSINECLTNRNGQVTSCINTGTSSTGIGDYLDQSKLRQLTTLPAATANFSTATGTAMTTPANNSSVSIAYGRSCNSAGTLDQAGTPRQFAILYLVETTAGGTGGQVRCLSS